MSALNDTADAIAATIAGVTEVGIVYAYQPFPVAEWDKFVAGFSTTIGGELQVRAWTVEYIGERRQERAVGIGSLIQRREVDWVVRGHMRHREPDSEGDFRDLVEAVCNAIDVNRALAGVAGCIDHDPVDVTLPDRGAPILLGDVVCHYAEVTFTSYHEQTLTTS